MQILGEVKDWQGLHQALRLRAEQLNTSRSRLDDISGLASGYCSKLLSKRPSRQLGWISFGAILQTLGLKLLVIDDLAALAQVQSRLVPRHHVTSPPLSVSPAVEALPAEIESLVAARMREVSKINGARGGHARAAAMTPEQRKRSARRAAKIRAAAMSPEERREIGRRGGLAAAARRQAVQAV
jgi:hypothetical protein